MLKIAFCGYRSWALDAINKIKLHSCLDFSIIITSKEDYDNTINTLPDDLDFIVFLGWSWIIPKEITDKYLCIGVHPSDLPDFRGGSSLQHQILAGITTTKATLFTLSEKIDAGDIWLKEDLSLEGDSMEEVFDNLTTTSIRLLNEFIFKYPDIRPQKQEGGTFYKRRKPHESRVNRDAFHFGSLERLYNSIRCLTDPYPNAYIEDDDGNRLYFTGVRYEKK